ncbi:hypothetical protein [Aquabacterium sp.]|uniref:hypothetical protein n=1 Tax=Aquabacterium sp. TaxID=1872578 RepID=UPI0040376F94
MNTTLVPHPAFKQSTAHAGRKVYYHFGNGLGSVAVDIETLAIEPVTDMNYRDMSRGMLPFELVYQARLRADQDVAEVKAARDAVRAKRQEAKKQAALDTLQSLTGSFETEGALTAYFEVWHDVTTGKTELRVDAETAFDAVDLDDYISHLCKVRDAAKQYAELCPKA